jgi:hypothetical protein
MSNVVAMHRRSRTPLENSPKPASNAKGTAYAQGDVLLLRVADVECAEIGSFGSPVILAEGEVTGHRHAFYGGATMFRDDALARDVPSELFIGHIKIAEGGAVLEHGTGPGERGATSRCASASTPERRRDNSATSSTDPSSTTAAT